MLGLKQYYFLQSEPVAVCLINIGEAAPEVFG